MNDHHTAGLGVLAGVGPAHGRDLRAFSEAALDLVRLRAGVNPIADVKRWHNAGASAVILQLLTPLPARRPLSPQSFVDSFSAEVEALLLAGESYVEIHDEPNRADRGLGVTWQDGAAFSLWFWEVAHHLRKRFGAELRIGFPALAPSSLSAPEGIVPIDELTFLNQCRLAVEDADWVALHIYWRSLEEMRAFDGAMRFLRTYLQPHPHQDFIVTEFANMAPDVPAQVRGRQYAEFSNLLSQYDHILGAIGFPLRSGDPSYRSLAWLDGEGIKPPIIAALAGRPRLPDPNVLRFHWPTEIQRYTQMFGENQSRYYDRYGLIGGHNGVDLAIGDPPEQSPIRAALNGTVTQVALDEDGYGHHIQVRSYGPSGEEITLLYAHLSRVEVTIGTLVSQGDIVGWGSRNAVDPSVAPHLHLGMRVSHIQSPATFDRLNPRPYLEDMR